MDQITNTAIPAPFRRIGTSSVPGPGKLALPWRTHVSEGSTSVLIMPMTRPSGKVKKNQDLKPELRLPASSPDHFGAALLQTSSVPSPPPTPRQTAWTGWVLFVRIQTLSEPPPHRQEPVCSLFVGAMQPGGALEQRQVPQQEVSSWEGRASQRESVRAAGGRSLLRKDAGLGSVAGDVISES